MPPPRLVWGFYVGQATMGDWNRAVGAQALNSCPIEVESKGMIIIGVCMQYVGFDLLSGEAWGLPWP